ncbi:gas vesicle protein GvpJ [Spartinivicinus ruber]|uniref:gas vesicle protein GvpJ n=1 Tax=Spartinivicinus ruber TaxID=2683272 RepID=UPI0013D239B8|nr:gas vesicle protein GvpJ [Spartinivicinus ruber]
MVNNQSSIQQSTNSTNIADLLERILDKGIVIKGDIKVKLVEVELLTIQIQLVICSVDKAKEIGIDWWNGDGRLLNREDISAGDAALLASIKKLNHRIEALEKQLD